MLFLLFYHHCWFSCRYMMFQKSIFGQPKWGQGPLAPVATALNCP